MNIKTLPGRRNFNRDPEEGSGGGTNTGTDGQPNDQQQGGPQQPPAQQPQAGAEAVDENGKGLGFPTETPTEQMTDAQRAAYWRNESKKQQRVADSRKDYDQQKADAEKWRAAQQEQMSASEKQIEAAKLEGKKEAARDNAMSSLRVILTSRGKSEADASDLLDVVSPDRFVTDTGTVDHQKVTAYADKVAPVGSSSQQSGGGGFGQGRYEQPNQSRSAAGKAEAEKRFGKKS